MRFMHLPSRLLDIMVLLWIMPPLGFLLTLLQSDHLRYLISNHILVAVLAGAIALRYQSRAPSRPIALRLLLVALLTKAFFCIEWVNFMAGRPTLDALTDIRMIIYSPMYGSIMHFVLYAIYLAMLDGPQQQHHLNFFVKLMCLFHVVFLAYWLLLYFECVPAIPKADLLRSNSTAYGALFVLCLMLLYRVRIVLRADALLCFMLVNVAVILVNRTRGAIIAMAAVALYLLADSLGKSRRPVVAMSMLVAMVGSAVALALTEGGLLTMVLGQDFGTLGAVLDLITAAYDNREPYVAVSSALVNDERTLSAFSRIGSNYFSLLSLLDNPFLGVGQAEAYAIDVIGSGVHSLHFLIGNATGFMGLATFGAILVALAFAQGPTFLTKGQAVMFILCFGYVLIFVNSIPIYFALVLMVLIDKHRKSAPIARSTSSNLKFSTGGGR